VRFDTSDPDLATISNRIRAKLIDLQPDFQRGEVWTVAKKQRLIDSILRKWHIPPVHLIKKDGGRFDVLDGQQRLTAIRDFIAGAFPVGSNIEPLDQSIESLAGRRYEQLPEDVRNEFDLFTIRIFALDDYKPGEPHELFFRLNQPTSLTEAEKRNAFIGGPRDQVKELVTWASSEGLTPQRLGFSNARMAYDDMLARFLLTLEQRTLGEKVTAARITDRYRGGDPFPSIAVNLARESLGFVLRLPSIMQEDTSVKPNKATIHTWLCMAAEARSRGGQHALTDRLVKEMAWIEQNRFTRHTGRDPVDAALLSIFHDRATSRVADVSSVILRDISAWLLITRRNPETVPVEDLRDILISFPHEIIKQSSDPEDAVYLFAQAHSWGLDEWI
jgi:hypothetical protein